MAKKLYAFRLSATAQGHLADLQSMTSQPQVFLAEWAFALLYLQEKRRRKRLLEEKEAILAQQKAAIQELNYKKDASGAEFEEVEQ